MELYLMFLNITSLCMFVMLILGEVVNEYAKKNISDEVELRKIKK